MTTTGSAAALPLSRAGLAETARQMVSEAGFDELTVRGVARRLGVSAPSLYEHVSNKDDLLDLVVGQILRDAARDWDPPSEWAALVRYIARWWHRVLSEHPEVYRSVLRRPMDAPVALDTVERVVTALTAAGLAVEESVAAYGQLFGYVVGATALVQTRSATRAAENRTEAEDRRRNEAALAELDAGQYPSVVAARAALAGLVSEDAVEVGIEVFIEGLRQRVAATIARTATR